MELFRSVYCACIVLGYLISDVVYYFLYIDVDNSPSYVVSVASSRDCHEIGLELLPKPQPGGPRFTKNPSHFWERIG